MAYLNKFIGLTDSLREFEADFGDSLLAESSKHLLEVHRDEVKTIWTSVKSAYEACLHEVAMTKDDDSDTELESLKARYRTSYLIYVRCVAKISEYISAFSVTELPTSTHSRNNDSPGHHFHLPPCDTEVFNGDYLSWPSFRYMFTAIYVNNSRLSPVEKLFHLNQKTRGEARDIVKKSPLTNEGFSQAWKNLRDRFENKRILVNSQLRILFNLSPVTTESGSTIKKLQRDINGCISALKLYDININNWDSVFIFLCSVRLPDATLALWEQSLQNKTEIPKWEELDSFLTSRYQTLETVSDIRSLAPPRQSPQKTASNSNTRNPSRKVSTYQANVTNTSCKLCTDVQHTIRHCPKFLDMNPVERLACVKKFGLCINCFAKAHILKDCKSNFNCFTCHKRHNTLLHRAISNSNSTSMPSISSNPPSGMQQSHAIQIQSTNDSDSFDTIQTCFASSSKSILLGTAVVNVCHRGITYSARALIDSGSEGTFISERLANLLKLPSRPIQAQISGLNNAVSGKSKKICSFLLSSPVNPSISIEASALVLPQLTGNLPTCSIDPAVFSKIPNITLADSTFYKSSHIDILIGGDLFPSIMLDGIKRNICNALLAQETIFGWILTGSVKTNLQSNSKTIVSYFNEISLDKEISRFWEVEDLPKKQFLTNSDRFCEEFYMKTTKRVDDGRYMVSLPFKASYPDHIKLGHSRSIASARFLRNEFRLCKNREFKIEYDNVIEEYLHLGHMEQVHPPKYTNSPSHYYLPHHAVIKPESTTTKVRVVFNASCPSSNGSSLNDILHTGPILQSDLTLLILKWRFFRFVFNGDIQKMYRQILVDPKHTPFQRILFRSSPQGEILDYELKTITFGVNCAPYLAIRTLHQLANDVENSYPLASSILRSSMYVDDALAGSHSISSAIQARDQLIAALTSAGFSMRKWTSNSRDILKGLPQEHLLNEDFLQLDDSSNAKTLGIRWNACVDRFFFSTLTLQQKDKFTKREVLSTISKLFDPAGWLAPCIVVSNILMQKIWLEQIGWDDELPANCLQSWHSFLANYPQIDSIQIPRWIAYTPDCDIEFHAFCDASEKAYAATIYVRIDPKLGPITTHLLTCKTRVAPVKTISIPRLELCGAVLLAEMVDALIPQLHILNYKQFFWTDSTIVLAWLRKPPCQWKTFVANRVTKIVESVGQANWFHVDTFSNPADLASRGISPQELVDNELWWHGPQWLKCSPASWPHPIQAVDHETLLEVKPIKSHFSFFQNFEDILERFSSFSKAIRVISYIFRFFYRTHPVHRTVWSESSIAITSSEVRNVKTRLITLCQKVGYPDEYQALSCRKGIVSSSSLLNLNPILDESGVMRVCGRLVFSPTMSYAERHPIILPYNCQLSRLLVRFTHEISLHGGNQLVLRLIRLEFWIPKVKNLIKTTIHHCKRCVIYKQRLRTQIMGTLPPERTTLTRPFTHTGLDFAGPFEIKNYTGRACLITKGYVCVFVCFSTKATHLEVTSTLATPAFLAAFNRFVSRRGCPLHLYSDNGKTFVGASRELARDFIQGSRNALTTNFAHQNLSWHFNPPGAPHMGGLWEAGVKSFKTHFRKVAGSFKYTFEEFSTLLSRIESCLNSRPLSSISDDPSDTSALTPGHFLIGSPLLAPIEPKINEVPVSIINRWQRLKALQQNFCSRWKNEYLKELHKRNKWKTPQDDVKENSLVVIREENLPPNEWRLGRVTRVYLGSDKRVRVADVLTQRGSITRPIVKLVTLPSQESTTL